MAGIMPRVLIVDDEKNIRSTLTVCLEGTGCEVKAAGSADAAFRLLQHERFDLCFLDLKLGETNTLEILPRILEMNPGLAVIMITAYATFETAVEAIKLGAKDYLPKPFTPAQIRHLVEKIADTIEKDRKIADLESRLKESVPEITFDTGSPKMKAALDTIMKAAPSDATVLIKGESGTGKGILARTLHMKSPRGARPFVTVNCPTLSGELLTSELFGHTRGAFTGAIQDKQGTVEIAEGGTLFLDEISEISPGLQAKLLRFLQERMFERLGETRTRQANVRIVAATNKDLEQAVKEGRFREDLLYRINVIEVTVPPLREREQDIIPLANSFLSFFARDEKKPLPELSGPTKTVMVSYPWPGNVRELRNVIERVVILCPSRTIEPEYLPERMVFREGSGSARIGGDHTLEEIEKEHIRTVLARSASLEEAAQVLGIDASTLWRKRKKLDDE
ncbi:MAG: sigma-54 dependent transcriptional regulator [Syntrophorhabdaceae bacterium]|nr:sigma-54 dependent transcriptional regulator [Syntrophorhabdaceae bacterium]